MPYYHVDNGGGDGDGSENNPWNNIAAHVDDLSPNDTMLIRGAAAPGRTYTEAQICPTVSGTSGNPIMVRPYTGEHVIIQTTGTYVLYLFEEDYWQFLDLALDRQSTWDASPATRVIQIYDANHNVIRCKIYNASDGIKVVSGDYNLFDDCEVYDNGTGMYLNGGTGNRVANCTFKDNRGDGIQCYDSAVSLVDAIIEDNHIYTTLGKCSENAIDVKQGNVIVRRNTMHGFRYCDGTCGGSGGGVGAAVVIHNDADDVVVEDNIIYDSASGITVAGVVNTKIRGNLIRDLVVDTNTWANIGIYIHAVQGGTGCKIFNNTLAHCPKHSMYYSGAGQVELKNNLFWDCQDITIEDTIVVTYDYNGWSDCKDTLAGAHDTTGSGDPGFIDAANDDYHLAGSSVCIDAGVDVGQPFVRTAPDLGCYEYEPEVVICMIM